MYRLQLVSNVTSWFIFSLCILSFFCLLYYAHLPLLISENKSEPRPAADVSGFLRQTEYHGQLPPSRQDHNEQWSSYYCNSKADLRWPFCSSLKPGQFGMLPKGLRDIRAYSSAVLALLAYGRNVLQDTTGFCFLNICLLLQTRYLSDRSTSPQEHVFLSY